MGNSHFDRVGAQRLVPGANVIIRPAYTLEDARELLDELDFSPDCLVLHQITNDIKYYSPEACVDYINDVVSDFTKKHPYCKVVISMGVPRTDDIILASNTEMLNVLIKQSILTNKNDRVIFCDHSNFMSNGYVKKHLMYSDGYHLSSEGLRVLCSNLRYKHDKVELTLGLSARRTRKITYAPSPY